MPEWNSFLLFVAAGLLLNITPGPDVLYIVGRSLGQGRLAGVVSSLGIATGCLVHIAAAALGLSAVMLALPLAFDAVRYRRRRVSRLAGVRALARRTAHSTCGASRPCPSRASSDRASSPTSSTPRSRSSSSRSCRSSPTRRGVAAAPVRVLGLVFVVNGTIVCLGYALAASWLGGWLKAVTDSRPGSIGRWAACSSRSGCGSRSRAVDSIVSRVTAHGARLRSRLRHGARRGCGDSREEDLVGRVDAAHGASNRRVSTEAQRLRLPAARRGAGGSRAGRRGDGPWSGDRPPARRADQRQGKLRRRGPAVHLGDPFPQELEGTGTCRGGAPAPGRRRGAARRDQCAAGTDGQPVLQRHLRHVEQPVGSHAHPWRLVGRDRRVAGGGDGVLQHRLRHWRQHS